LTHSVIEPAQERLLPALTPTNRAFWTGGADGLLLVQHCAACDHWYLPSVDACGECGATPAYAPVSGRGNVYTYSTNHHQYHPAIAPPNLIAIVVLDEQDDLRVATNLVNCTEADIAVGTPVGVLFENHGEIFYPVFEPTGAQR
jgi:uncharacterized protein